MFLLSGCSVNYNLNITDNSINETISGSVTNSELRNKSISKENSGNIYKILLDTPQFAIINNEDELYDSKIKKGLFKEKFVYSYNFDFDSYSNSNILNNCFSGHLISNDEQYLYISVFGNFTCNYADKTKITINTNYYVNDNNAGKVKNNKYTWEINKNNADDVELYIMLSKNNKVSKQKILTPLRVAALIIIVVLGAIIMYIKKKMEVNS